MKNSSGKMPNELFVYEHKYLMSDGKNFMKRTAGLGMMSIAIVVFMFALLCLNINWMPSKVVAMLSLLSLFAPALMFMTILLSRFSAEDFLYKLPLCLVAGLSAFFISVVPVTVAVYTALCHIFYRLAIFVYGARGSSSVCVYSTSYLPMHEVVPVVQPCSVSRYT